MANDEYSSILRCCMKKKDTSKVAAVKTTLTEKFTSAVQQRNPLSLRLPNDRVESYYQRQEEMNSDIFLAFLLKQSRIKDADLRTRSKSVEKSSTAVLPHHTEVINNRFTLATVQMESGARCHFCKGDNRRIAAHGSYFTQFTRDGIG
ncbi:hypothetical protein T11_14485 [Trichinella zimbabwensis]|uniref:Uncharacterized protein n=1 Tax=Trichinella zimbabwensis TaxID=268475 RepID=A0A0V1H0T7_9BILA|nr:hypothetical protein T11_14485 [Trichinella zimbabwensis]